MKVYTKYCRRKHNLATGCRTFILGTPDFYRKLPSGVKKENIGLTVDPTESLSLIHGESGIRSLEIRQHSGGRSE